MESPIIDLSQCKKGRVYKLHSRNLSYGVFDGNVRFIGIRTKCGHIFLDTEDHWETGPPFGTARPYYDTGIDVPEEINLYPLDNEGKPIDKITGKEVAFDKSVLDGGKGWYFKDTGESSDKISPTLFINRRLFEFMEKIEAIDS